MRSLVVEDEFTSRMQIKHFLEEHGNCDTAANGAEGVEAYKLASFARRPYDLVCIDINLPDKSGLDVLLEIRRFELYQGASLGAPARIFMTTAQSTPDCVSASLGLCNEYLLKPIEKRKLTDRLIKHGLIK
jgi:two-component system chemotaxis response regulator CheY